jgi:hypothetical protein
MLDVVKQFSHLLRRVLSTRFFDMVDRVLFLFNHTIWIIGIRTVIVVPREKDVEEMSFGYILWIQVESPKRSKTSEIQTLASTLNNPLDIDNVITSLDHKE